jgi:hypothetical protein
MLPRGSSAVRPWGGSTSTPGGEGARAFQQRRLAFFIALSFILWLAIGVLSQLAALAWSPEGGPSLAPMLYAHIGATAVLGAFWLLARARPLSSALLGALDVASTVVQGATAGVIVAFTLPAFRADLYALGAVGYFLLTGEPVFQGKTAVDVMARTLHHAPEPPSRRSGRAIPPKLEQLVMRCLEKEPERRPESAGALRTALLDSDVSAWSTADARAWWTTRAERVREAGGSTVPSPFAATLAVAPREAR